MVRRRIPSATLLMPFLPHTISQCVGYRGRLAWDQLLHVTRNWVLGLLGDHTALHTGHVAPPKMYKIRKWARLYSSFVF